MSIFVLLPGNILLVMNGKLFKEFLLLILRKYMVMALELSLQVVQNLRCLKFWSYIDVLKMDENAIVQACGFEIKLNFLSWLLCTGRG